MNSRNSILGQFKANKPEFIALPEIDINVFNENLDDITEFIKKVEVVGGNVVAVKDNQDAILKIKEAFPGSKVNYSNIPDTDSFNTVALENIKNPHELEDLDVLVLESSLGVAENGSVWLTDNEIPIRVLPFITKHLVIILSKDTIVSYVHDAYAKIGHFNADFGVFISGPSKTADIEQSLVIGAQGAMSLTVFLK